jgi:nickel transport protein
MSVLLSFRSGRYRRFVYGPALFALLWVLQPGPAQAHRVSVFAWVEGETVHTESKFSGGKPVNGGEILVFDLEGNQLLSGKTDARGGFSFAIPKRTGMRIVIQAGMGHRGEWTIPAGEVAPDGPKPEPSTARQPLAGATAPPTAAPDVSLDEVRLAVEEALDQRLGPVLKMLAERQDSGPTLRDVLGGLGYVLGLMGLAAYIHFRRRGADPGGERKG